MAVRGSAARHVPGYPMAGVLRELNRQARAPLPAAVEASQPPAEASTPPPAPASAAAVVAQPQLAVGVVVTDVDGCASMRFPHAYPTPPVIAAVAVAPRSHPDQVVTVMVEDVTAEHVTVRAWLLPTDVDDARVAAGVHVHLTAAAATLA